MSQAVSPPPSPTRRQRLCARIGCHAPVKKATAKYCSVSCCSTDPQRLLMLRDRSRRASRLVLPMTRQLSIPFPSLDATEQLLASLCEGREDTPMGMARLVV